MNNTFENSECNGWAIIPQDDVDCASPKNYHVAEIRITNDGQVYWNKSMKTCCGLPIRRNATKLTATFRSYESNKLRETLASFQNVCKETCGTCVSHFYADKEA